MLDESIRLARERFPTGLVQPEGSYRFGLDALLLAEFAASCVPEITPQPSQNASPTLRFADLGTGCGAAGLSFLLRTPEASGIGIEIDTQLVAAARQNATLLGLDDRFNPVEADIADTSTLKHFRKTTGSMDLVLVNPPWRLEGCGRIPPHPSRRRALFGTAQTFSLFAAAAALLLRRGGVSVWICGAYRIVDLFAALTAVSLNPSFLCSVHHHPAQSAELALVGARLQGRESLVVRPPYFIA